MELRNYLPHRYPFLLVDRVLSFEENKILALKNVSFNEPFFQGHFPSKPIMPGVLMLEALAQAAGILASHILELKDPMFFLGAIDNAKFKRMVVPGDQLILSVQIERRMRNVWRFNGKASVNEQLACSAKLTCALATD